MNATPEEIQKLKRTMHYEALLAIIVAIVAGATEYLLPDEPYVWISRVCLVTVFFISGVWVEDSIFLDKFAKKGGA